MLASLHCLPVKSRIEFKLLLLTLKALHGQGPSYPKEPRLPYYPTRTLHSQNAGLFVVPMVSSGSHQAPLLHIRIAAHHECSRFLPPEKKFFLATIAKFLLRIWWKVSSDNMECGTDIIQRSQSVASWAMHTLTNTESLKNDCITDIKWTDTVKMFHKAKLCKNLYIVSKCNHLCHKCGQLYTYICYDYVKKMN